MSLSKECFPDSSECHNCIRKITRLVKKDKIPKENSKRCGNCHLMTYCDTDCQKEHWLRVHKKHCKFLSGKAPVKDSSHDAATCSQCIEERETSPTLINSENSSKTSCNIEGVAKSMKKSLSDLFEFHGQGKKCSSMLEHGLQLPFAIGEVSGQYLEIAGTGGLDPMLAHAYKIVKAMIVKAKDDERKTALFKLLRIIIRVRADLWYEVLVRGTPWLDIKALTDQVDSLRSVYSATDPWWKVLRFSSTFIAHTADFIQSNFYDFNSLDDPRFLKFKLINDYHQSQLQILAMVSEMKTWPKFMLWPQLVNGSLTVLLPPGTLCQTCNAQLSGEAATSPYDAITLPFLFPYVGDTGALVACCPPVQKPACLGGYVHRNVHLKMKSDEELRKEYKEEDKIFTIGARFCDFCLKSSLSSHRCSACLSVQYCSTTCQKKDLDIHKSVCGTWAEDESRELLSGRKQKKNWKKFLAENPEK